MKEFTDGFVQKITSDDNFLPVDQEVDQLHEILRSEQGRRYFASALNYERAHVSFKSKL